MSEKIDTFIAAGCSFTGGLLTWPNHLANYYDVNLINLGETGAGNGLISRTIIHNINKLLNNISNEQILVGIMWSGADRIENYHTDHARHKSRLPYKFVKDDDGVWVKINIYKEDWYTASYIKNFYDNVGSYIYTLEHILRTQWFLEKHKIQYFMTTHYYEALPNKEMQQHPSIKYLYDMIDFSKFLPVDNCLSWCENSGVQGATSDDEQKSLWKNHTNKVLYSKTSHPTTAQQKAFFDRVINKYVDENFKIRVRKEKQDELQ